MSESFEHQDSAIIFSKLSSVNKMSKSTVETNGVKHEEASGANGTRKGSSKKRRRRSSNRSRSRSNSFNNSPVAVGPRQPQQQPQQVDSNANAAFMARQKNVRFSVSNSVMSLPSASNPASMHRVYTHSGFNNRARRRSNGDPQAGVFIAIPNNRSRRMTVNNNKPGLSNDFVSREVMDYYHRNRQSNDKYKAKKILRESLENTLKTSFPNYFINLHIIGSSTNGIGDNASTVDICVLAQKKSVMFASPPDVQRTGGENGANGDTPANNNSDDGKESPRTVAKDKGDQEKEKSSSNEEKVVMAAADSNSSANGDDANENDLSLKQIEKILHSKNFAKNIVLIPARVPIIKFKDIICNMNVTLNLNQEVSIRNTQLVRDYSKMDWRFPQLAMIAKEWARENRINSAVDKSISPYSWTLMVIHYLQAVEPPVLPCLQKLFPHRYDVNVSIDEERNVWRQAPMKWQSKNTSTMKQLIRGFFRYYGYVFRYDQHIISVREGKVLNRIYCQPGGRSSTDDNAIQWNALVCVEEPFTRSNTTRCVKDHETFERIKELLRMSSNALKGNRISLFNIIVDDLDWIFPTNTNQ